MPTVSVNGIELFYEDLNPSGSEERPILLITGLGGVGAAWGPLVPLLTAARRVIIPDHRGCGRSTHTTDGHTISQNASDMADLVRSLGSGPMHVVGSSTGGAIGQRMAIEHPDTIASCVGIDSWGRSDQYFIDWFRVRKDILMYLPYSDHVDITQLLLYSPDYWNKKTERRLSQHALLLQKEGQPTDIDVARISMVMAHDAISELGTVSIPALAITGSEDIFCPPYLGKELAAAFPKGRFELLDGLGHYSHEEDPHLVSAMVLEFLSEIESSSADGRQQR